MKKIAYIIAGYGESYSSRPAYGKIAGFFKSRDIETVPVHIDWHNKKPRVFGDYQKQFIQQYKKIKKYKKYVLGFSFGAMVAFLTATKLKPTALILCSLSPYFKEDLARFKPSWLNWWRKNFVGSDYSFDEIAPKIKTKTYLLVESVDADQILHRTRQAKKKMPNVSVTIIKNAKHNIGQKEYLNAIERIIFKLP